MKSPTITRYPGSPKTKLCPLVGNPLHGSSQRPATLFGRLDFQGTYLYQWPFIILSTKPSLKDPPMANSHHPPCGAEAPDACYTMVRILPACCRSRSLRQKPQKLVENVACCWFGNSARPFFEKKCCCCLFFFGGVGGGLFQ